MIYKGFDFNVVQGITPRVWKWSVSTGGSRGKAGQDETERRRSRMACDRSGDRAEEDIRRAVSR
jgi:hypothetical protein